MTRKVAVVGSTVFPLTAATGAEVVDALRSLGDEAAVLTRGAKGFEQFLVHACIVLGLRCFQYAGHGLGNWERDAELVQDADEVIAFVAMDSLDDPRTGTAHLLEVALAARKPVRVATACDDRLYWVEAGAVSSASS